MIRPPRLGRLPAHPRKAGVPVEQSPRHAPPRKWRAPGLERWPQPRPRPHRAPPRCEVIKCSARSRERCGHCWGFVFGCSSHSQGPPAPSSGAVAAPVPKQRRRQRRSPAPVLDAKPWPRRPGHGPGAQGKAASRRAVTCTGFSMKTLIAAYSGVLRGEHPARAAPSESCNRSVCAVT